MNKPQQILILPDIRSCHNVGAMFRTADACNFDKLYLVGYTAHPPKPQIDKVSLGAETWVPWEAVADLQELVVKLKAEGYTVIALEKNDTSLSIEEYTPEVPVALIVGNEVDGVSEDILALCDHVLHLPMYGRKESLNVSVAAGIAMYTLNQKRR